MSKARTMEIALSALGEKLGLEVLGDGAHVVRNEHYFLLSLRSGAQMERSKSDAAQFAVLWTPLAEAVEQLTYLAEQEVARQAVAVYQQQLKKQ